MVAVRVRREPPAFRQVVVRQTDTLTPHLLRMTLQGGALAGFALPRPGASVRLLLPPAGRRDIVLPTWDGNEFLHADGNRPNIRTYTPRAFDPIALALTIDIVLHDSGAVPAWALAARPGDPGAVAGPGRGYEIDERAAAFVLAGDASALPAISQLLEQLPPAAMVTVLIEVDHEDARLELPAHPRATVEWRLRGGDEASGAPLLAALRAVDVTGDVRIWAAGEAAAMQRIRQYLFEGCGLSRSQAVVRGYWKLGRGGDVTAH